MRKYILFFMLLAFSMGAAAQPQITRKPKSKKEKAKPNNAQRNQKPAANQSQKPKPKVAYKNKTFTINGVSFNMVYVAGGTFQMGSNVGDYDEKPVHSVTLSDYYIGQTEVTQELWQAVMGSNPSDFKGAKNPVNNVSWNDCQEFIIKLNRLTCGASACPLRRSGSMPPAAAIRAGAIYSAAATIWAAWLGTRITLAMRSTPSAASRLTSWACTT